MLGPLQQLHRSAWHSTPEGQRNTAHNEDVFAYNEGKRGNAAAPDRAQNLEKKLLPNGTITRNSLSTFVLLCLSLVTSLSERPPHRYKVLHYLFFLTVSDALALVGATGLESLAAVLLFLLPHRLLQHLHQLLLGPRRLQAPGVSNKHTGSSSEDQHTRKRPFLRFTSPRKQCFSVSSPSAAFLTLGRHTWPTRR